MNDPISRQAAIDAVRSYYDEVDTSEKSIEERIADLPPAQSEIVRCRECKHYKLSKLSSMGMLIRICEYWKLEDVDDDDYCSRAERGAEWTNR